MTAPDVFVLGTLCSTGWLFLCPTEGAETAQSLHWVARDKVGRLQPVKENKYCSTRTVKLFHVTVDLSEQYFSNRM